MKTLELIQKNCTGIATVEASICDTFELEFANHSLDRAVAAEALDFLDAQFKAISWLQEVLIHVYSYEGPSDNLRKKMLDYGWKIKVTEPGELMLRPEEEEFDYEGYLFMRREQETEEQAWEEEYHRRRRDPYWKNDSDYD